MYRKQVRRRRAVLIGLVLAGFLLLTFTFGQGSGGSGLIGTIFGPVENATSRALKPARDLFSWFDETMAARGDKERLERELAETRSLAVAGKVALEENKQLRKLAGLKARRAIPGAYSPVAASVVSRSPTVWFSTVGLDAGSADGISVNDPVINGDGLVGRISEVTRGQSVVTLITDSSSAVSAKVLPGGAQGVVRPKIGAPGTLLLEFLDDTKNIGKGQSVVTSGWRDGELSSFYPARLPIGEVARAPIDEREAIQSVELRPYPDIRNFDLVQVLTGGSRG
jgi:rod shape-determining protein MreC